MFCDHHVVCIMLCSLFCVHVWVFTVVFKLIARFCFQLKARNVLFGVDYCLCCVCFHYVVSTMLFHYCVLIIVFPYVPKTYSSQYVYFHLTYIKTVLSVLYVVFISVFSLFGVHYCVFTILFSRCGFHCFVFTILFSLCCV